MIFVSVQFRYTLYVPHSLCCNLKPATRKHQANIEELILAHETKLDKLERYEAKSANEIDVKLSAVQRAMREQKSYLARAQKLLDTRYK